MRGPDLISGFLDIELVSCNFHGCWVKETLNSYFYGSIKFKISSIIDWHMCFVCTRFGMNPYGRFNVFVLTIFSGAASLTFVKVVTLKRFFPFKWRRLLFSDNSRYLVGLFKWTQVTFATSEKGLTCHFQGLSLTLWFLSLENSRWRFWMVFFMLNRLDTILNSQISFSFEYIWIITSKFGIFSRSLLVNERFSIIQVLN